MTSRIIAVEPFDLVVFGGAGDLAYRKLLPALYHRHRDGQIADGRRASSACRGAAMSDARVPRGDQARRSPSTSPRRTATRRWSRLSSPAAFRPGRRPGRGRLGRPRQAARSRARTASAPSTSPSAPELFGTICGKLGAHGLVTPKTRVDHREADRPRPRLGARGQRRGRRGLRRAARSTASTTISARRRCRT